MINILNGVFLSPENWDLSSFFVAIKNNYGKVTQKSSHNMPLFLLFLETSLAMSQKTCQGSAVQNTGSMQMILKLFALILNIFMLTQLKNLLA